MFVPDSLPEPLARLLSGRSARRSPDGGTVHSIEETVGFGANPGGLRMLSFVPSDLPAGAPLMVALHGCTQSADAYDRGAGWSVLARRHGFAVLLAEQRAENNPNRCFNWFQPSDIARGQGEVASVAAMVDHMARAHALDRSRVFVTGLSAGGAMAAALLATYPDVFAGGAIIAGLPFGCAASVQEALEAMVRDRPRTGVAWGDLVRAASPHREPWPRVSIWHGDADTTVRPSNARASLAQWLDVHGLALESGTADRIDDCPHRIWRDRSGRAVIETYTIPGMGHGTPIAPGARDAAQRCGEAGPFMLDAGISSSWRIAQWCGLVGAEAIAGASAAPPRPPEPDARGRQKPEARPRETAPSGPGAVIERALRAAGLMRGE